MLGRLRRSLRRWALVGLVLAMVVSAGAIAMVGASRATGSQANVHRSDRLALAQSLATLAAGYFQQLETSQLGVAELLPQRVSDQPAAARPDALARAVGSLSGSPMAVEATGITPVLTATGAVELARAWPAMAPGMAAGLAAGGAAVSGVEWIGGRPTVVIATGPGASSPGAPALVVAYELADLPIAAYVQKLRIAPGAVPYLLDRSGRLLTSPVTAQVGRPAPEVARAEAAGRQTPAVVQAGGPFPQVVAVVPVGEGGGTWSSCNPPQGSTVLCGTPTTAFAGSSSAC